MSKWDTNKLEELCSIITDGTHQTPEYCDDGVIFLSSKDVTSRKINWSHTKFIPESLHNKIRKQFDPQIGDVLLAKNGTTGVAAIVDRNEKFSFYVSLCLLRPKEILYPNYLLYIINSPICKNQFNSKLKGIGVPNLHLKDIRECKIPLPPLTEQKRIVKLLDQAQALIDKRKQQIEFMDSLVKSVFYEMFGDPVKNEKGWEVKKLRDLTTKIGSGATPTGGDSSYKTDGISLIRSLNVRMGYFQYSDLAFIDNEQASKLNNVCVQKNDVLLNITGASVARCCIVPENVLPARVNQHVSIIRSKETLNNNFLMHLLISQSMQSNLWKIAESGATRQAITKQQIEELLMIVPNKKLQNQFAERVQKIESVKQSMQSSLKELEHTFNSLMQQSFGA